MRADAISLIVYCISGVHNAFRAGEARRFPISWKLPGKRTPPVVPIRAALRIIPAMGA
jgi:hypothetical protein